MGISYNVRLAGKVCVVDAAGEMTLSERIASQCSGALHDLVRDLLEKGHKKIVLNLQNVKYLDSSGIGELFACYSTVHRQGGVLKLCNPIERVLVVLRLTKFTAVVGVVQDESAAVRSLSDSRAASAQ